MAEVDKAHKSKEREKDKEKKKHKKRDKADAHFDDVPTDAAPSPFSPLGRQSSGTTGIPSTGAAGVASANVSNGSRLVHACLVDLYELFGNGQSKGHGPKGLALVKSIDHSYSVLTYQPSTTKHELVVPLSLDFDFTVLPDRWCTFYDTTGQPLRQYSVKFATVDDSHAFARSLALCKDDLSSFEHTKGGARRVIVQDLVIGTGDLSVASNDSVKIKYTVSLTSNTHPIGIGEKLVSKESKRFVVGSGAVSLGIEQGLIGMKKKGYRFLVIPPTHTESDAFDFGPLVPPHSTLLIEVQVTSLHSDRTSDANDATGELDRLEEELTQAVNGHNHPPQHQHSHGHSHGQTMAGSTHAQMPVHRDSHGEDGPSLKDRMKLLSIAAQTPALAITPVLSAHTTQHSPQYQHQHQRPRTPTHFTHPTANSHTDELDQFLTDLQMSEFLPNFKREGVHFSDLPLLADDASDELKMLVPLMGPRRRLLAKLQEMKDGASKSPTSVKSPTAQTAPAASHTQSYSHSSYNDHHEAELTRAEELQRREREMLAQRALERDRQILHDRELAARERERQAAAAAAEKDRLDRERERLKANDASYQRGYEAGKEEALALARERINDMKESASIKFSELKSELSASETKNSEDIKKAREIIAGLRAEVKALQEERTALISTMKSSMDDCYQQATDRVDAKQLYEGSQLMEIVKKILKTVSSSVDQAQHTQAQR